MQDGKNLFFPEEAFLGHEWQVDEALQMLDETSAIDKVVVVGVHCGDRMEEYTKPGYESYARSVVEEIKPEVDRRLRVLTDPADTGVIGSSLGGVVSFYMAWEYPEVFGFAACMSSTFCFRDDLVDRVLAEPKRSVEDLPRQRLAGRQLRGHAGDGDGARHARLRAAPGLPPPRLPARDARRGGLGPAAPPPAAARSQPGERRRARKVHLMDPEDERR